ncbi:universal stress protein [Limibaculum sp. M0105]|uniref:Universal stress protein n=1 Tax=Thermohalobaculum xanthum TaxID=2753746 RepID=A0A8J7SBL6_9RHOB|nr:universal stress protein [Thermohalobaculum xanthum]MBK0397726.1 universal stress protein [Thermohalobaculum xanthum]
MYKNVLVPVALDHAEKGNTALAVARQLLDQGGQITLLHVMEEIPGFAASHLPEGTLRRNEDAAVNALRELAGGAGDVTPKVVWGHSGRTILDYAEDNKTDCIVIASHKPGLEDYFLGSTAARVVRHAQCCVHVMR